MKKQAKIRSENLAWQKRDKSSLAWELCLCILGGVCSGELPLSQESLDKLHQFECKVSAPVDFVLDFLYSTDLALKLQQLFVRWFSRVK